MTVMCMDCRSFLYEKCRDCGAICDTTMQANLDGQGMREYFICPTLECEMVLFEAGQGGVSHGICPPCLARREAELKFQIQDCGFRMGSSASLGATR